MKNDRRPPRPERKIRPADPPRPTDELFDDEAEMLPIDWPRLRER